MSPLLKLICQQTYTINDLHRRLRLMQECLEVVLYDASDQIEAVPVAVRRDRFIKSVSREDDVHFLLSLTDEIWDSITPANLSSTVKSLLSEADKLPIMTLYVPVVFTDKQLAPISAWVRREVEPRLMLDILVDPKVVGGCAFVYKDTHFDWSLRRYLRAKRGMVTSLLNSYGH